MKFANDTTDPQRSPDGLQIDRDFADRGQLLTALRAEVFPFMPPENVAVLDSPAHAGGVAIFIAPAGRWKCVAQGYDLATAWRRLATSAQVAAARHRHERQAALEQIATLPQPKI